MARNQWEQFSLAAASIGATFAAVGTLNYPSIIIVLTNLTDGDVQVSFGGAKDSIPVKAGTVANLTTTLPKGTVVSVKDITATGSGNFYVSSMYTF